jgi:hypothetical protein
MRLAIAAALLICWPLLAQPPGGVPEKIKPTTVRAVLDTIPSNLLAPTGVWSQADLLEVDHHLKLVSPGHKMFIQVQIVNVEVKELSLSLSGPLQLLDYAKLTFRGNDLIARPFIDKQDFLALPLVDKAILQKAQPGQLVKLLATTARITLTKTNADVYFDGTLDKTVLLAVSPPPGTEGKP